MLELLRFVVLGIALGSVYALPAHGIVLISRGSGVLSFAQGGFAFVGAYLYYRGISEYGWSAPIAALVAIGVPAVMGILTHVLVMERLRTSSALIRLVATLGVLFFLIAAGQQIWGYTFDNVTSPLPSGPRRPFGGNAAIPEDRLWLILISLAITTLLWALYRWSRFGRSTEAVAENSVAASALGVSPRLVSAANWALGSALAGLTGIFLAPIIKLGVVPIAFVVLRSIAAALIGQFRSFWGTWIGAVAIGVAESLLNRYVAEDGPLRRLTWDGGLFGLFTPQAVGRSATFLILIVILVWRGDSIPTRGVLFDRFPALGSGRVPLRLVGLLTVLGTVLVLWVPPNWGNAFIVSLSTAIVCLSIVVVTGYVGQLSLAQAALAGLAAWSAGRLHQAYGLPLLLAGLIGLLVTVLAGVLAAVPALRTRGVNLAVLTLGLAIVINELVLGNSKVTGGLQGTEIEPLTLFGVSFNAFEHPGRYAAVVLVLLVGCSIVVANLRRGRGGRRMIAVRDNERAAAALGINAAETKLFAFAFGAALAGIGGMALAFRQGHVNYVEFAPLASITMLVNTVVGGVGYVLGALTVAWVAAGGVGGEIMRSFGLDPLDISWISGLALLVTLSLDPNGIVHQNARSLARHRERLARRRNGRDDSTHVARAEVSDANADPPVHNSGHVLPKRNLEQAFTQLGVRGKRGDIALALSGLTVRFGAVPALSDVSLDVRYGEVLGLIGPNGAGKTTLIDAVTGFVRPDSGDVRIGAHDVGSLPAHKRARAGLSRSFQSLELFEDMTVRENLLVASDEQGRSPYLTAFFRRGAEEELSPSALAAIEAFALEPVLDVKPSELPYGTRRLVAIARAVAIGPEVLLLDEPAAGLSEGESQELGDLIRELARRADLAVLVVEHDMDLVMSVCDRVVVLVFGVKVADATPGEVAVDPAVVDAYLGGQDSDGVSALATGGDARLEAV